MHDCLQPIKFPEQPRAATSGASFIEKAGSRIRRGACRALNRLGLPACVQPVELVDELSGVRVRIRIGESFAVLSVNGRDFYFDRITGRFDGTGTGCA